MTGISATEQQQNIEKAARCTNPLESFPDFLKYNRNDLNLSITCKQKSCVDSKQIKWAFKLAESNVGKYYRECKMGWQPKIKQNDLNKNWARYLIATDIATKQPVGYSMFRFDLDYGACVLYCYEMHVTEDYQNKGLGTFMMKALENVAALWKMEKIVLTVLKNDEGAMRFYKRLDYLVDESSPDKSEESDYEILSKLVV